MSIKNLISSIPSYVAAHSTTSSVLSREKHRSEENPSWSALMRLTMRKKAKFFHFSLFVDRGRLIINKFAIPRLKMLKTFIWKLGDGHFLTVMPEVREEVKIKSHKYFNTSVCYFYTPTYIRKCVKNFHAFGCFLEKMEGIITLRILPSGQR